MSEPENMAEDVVAAWLKRGKHNVATHVELKHVSFSFWHQYFCTDDEKKLVVWPTWNIIIDETILQII